MCWHPDGDEGATRAEAVWKGHNGLSRELGLYLRLYKRTWENPSPEIEIESIDLVSAPAPAQPFLIAITAEE